MKPEFSETDAINARLAAHRGSIMDAFRQFPKTSIILAIGLVWDIFLAYKIWRIWVKP